MAQKKRRKHGKVEARKARPVIRFKPGVLLLLILVGFLGCFALYLISATSQPDYWEKEIIGSTQSVASDEEAQAAVPSAAVNPVPASERAADTYLTMCAFMGNAVYEEMASDLLVTDAIFTMSESELKTQAERFAKADPFAVYLWETVPEDEAAALKQLRFFVEHLHAVSRVPVYLLPQTPAEDAAENRRVDAWNAALFGLADALGVHYVDVNTTLKSNAGTLAAAYAEETARRTAVEELLLTHVAE